MAPPVTARGYGLALGRVASGRRSQLGSVSSTVAFSFSCASPSLQALCHSERTNFMAPTSPDLAWYGFTHSLGQGRVFALDPLLAGHEKGHSNTWRGAQRPIMEKRVWAW